MGHCIVTHDRSDSCYMYDPFDPLVGGHIDPLAGLIPGQHMDRRSAAAWTGGRRLHGQAVGWLHGQAVGGHMGRRSAATWTGGRWPHG